MTKQSELVAATLKWSDKFVVSSHPAGIDDIQFRCRNCQWSFLLSGESPENHRCILERITNQFTMAVSALDKIVDDYITSIVWTLKK